MKEYIEAPRMRIHSAKRISVEPKTGGPIGGGTLGKYSQSARLHYLGRSGLRVSATKRD